MAADGPGSQRLSAGGPSGGGSAPSKGSGLGRRPEPGLRLGGFTSLKKEDGNESSDDEDAWRQHSGPVTPNIAETAQQLKRSLSVHGLHELAHMPPAQIRKSVGEKFWRPSDEAARIPSDWERLAVHVIRGTLRGFNLAFLLRGTVMVLFAFIKAIRSKKFKGRDIASAMFGPANVRFGLVLGLWAGIYKAVHNALRLLTTVPVSRRQLRSRSNPEGSGAAGAILSTKSTPHGSDGEASGTVTPVASQDMTDEQKAKEKARRQKKAFMPDPRSKVWHAYLAGACSGLAILAERKDSRIGLAQQLVVRGLEGTYNVAHSKGLINIPHGAVLTFGLACGQIMYAWLDQPDSLPRSYTRWITDASKVTPNATPIHRHSPKSVELLMKHFPDGKLPEPYTTSAGKLRYAHVPANAYNRRGIHGKVVGKLVKWIEDRKAGVPFPDHVDCAIVHPWEHNHWWSPVDRFIEVTRWILPVYMTLYFVPAVFLRMKSFRKDPVRVFLRSLFGSIRSSSFLGVFVIIFQTWFCACHSLYDRIQSSPYLKASVPLALQRFLISDAQHWIGGFLTCLSLFVDHSRRRAELAMYVVPKAAESAWSLGRQRSWVPFVPGGDVLLTSIGTSLIMGTYARNPEFLSGVVRRVVYQFVGRN